MSERDERPAWADQVPPSVFDWLPPTEAERLRDAMARLLLAAARVRVERGRAAADRERGRRD